MLKLNLLTFYFCNVKQRQPASSKHGNSVIDIDTSQGGRNLPGSNVTPWTKLVLEMYAPGTSVRYVHSFLDWDLSCRPFLIGLKESK